MDAVLFNSGTPLVTSYTPEFKWKQGELPHDKNLGFLQTTGWKALCSNMLKPGLNVSS